MHNQRSGRFNLMPNRLQRLAKPKPRLGLTTKKIARKAILRYPLKTFVSVITVGLSLSACSTAHHPDDPWYGWNRGVHTFNEDADRFVIKPVAEAYQWITPEFIDQGVTNVFENIEDVRVTINDLLQLKMAQGGMDFSRLLVNSTLGVGGIFDVATLFDLPKHNEDFGQTLGVWGVESGPYLVLPIFGPSTPRDTVGLIGDAFFNPLTYIAFIGSTANIGAASSRALDLADTRSDSISSEKIIEEAASSSVNSQYNFIKNAYEQRREYLVEDGKMTEDDLAFEDALDTLPSGQETGQPDGPTPSSGHLNLSPPDEGL